MKKSTLINSEISYVISKLGHKDRIVVGDAGLPISKQVQRIDVAISKGIPGFMPVLKAILSEQKIEKVILAEEIKDKNPSIHHEILSELNLIMTTEEIGIEIEYMPHELFKKQTNDCMVAVRTGEFTPFANIILISAVVF